MANAYLGLAELMLGDSEPATPAVAVGVAVLAGIAAADALCARRLLLIHRGEDHRAAADLLSGATPDGPRLAMAFKRLIDLKDEAHYGVTLLSAAKARKAVGWARTLVARANEELER